MRSKISQVKDEPKKRVIVPSRPRSPKTAEQIREKIYRKMAGRKKNAATTATTSGGGGGGKAREQPTKSSIESMIRKAKVDSSRPK